MTSHREIIAPGKGTSRKLSAGHDTTKQREELYGLTGQYLDAYNTIVQPKQVFPISYYALRCWTPVLGAVGFWLLVTMQQICYRRSEAGNWCIVDQATLATEANIGVRTLQRYLHGKDYVRSGLAHWIKPSSQGQAGKTKRLYRYEVTLDAPLVRPHQYGLAQYLYEHGGKPGASLADVRPALEHLIGLGRLKYQTDLLDEYAARFEPPAGWREDGFYSTVGDVVGTLGLAKSTKEMLGLCSEAHHALTGADWLCTQYFRRRLMPLMGHKLALVVVQLRSRCFWNESGKRDVVSDIGTSELARLAGCTDGWIRAICDSPDKGKVSPDGCEQQAELARLFFHRIESGVGKRPVFHVMLREPIAPQDKDSYLELLEMQIGAQSVLPLWPETEKVIDDEDPIEGHETHVVAELDGTNACGGVSNACGGVITEDETHVVAELDGTNACGGVSNACGGVHVKHFKHEREENSQNVKQEKHPLVTFDLKNRLLKIYEATTPTTVILKDFLVRQPWQRKIAEVRSPEWMLAWCLQTVVEYGLNDTGLQGYIVNRNKDEDKPDDRFEQWARLSPTEWRALWTGSCLVDAELEMWQKEYAALSFYLREWKEDFGSLWSHGPFGDQQRHSQVTRLSGEEGIGSDGLWMKKAMEWTREQEIWQETLSQLQMQMPRATFDTWVRPSVILSYEEDVVVIGAHNGYAKDWLENRLRGIVQRVLSDVIGHDVLVRFELQMKGQGDEV